MGGCSLPALRELEKTTTMIVKREWQKERSNGPKNSSACAFKNFVHFLALLCKKDVKYKIKAWCCKRQ